MRPRMGLPEGDDPGYVTSSKVVAVDYEFGQLALYDPVLANLIRDNEPTVALLKRAYVLKNHLYNQLLEEHLDLRANGKRSPQFKRPWEQLSLPVLEPWVDKKVMSQEEIKNWLSAHMNDLTTKQVRVTFPTMELIGIITQFDYDKDYLTLDCKGMLNQTIDFKSIKHIELETK